jgi:hypothetical protein
MTAFEFFIVFFKRFRFLAIFTSLFVTVTMWCVLYVTVGRVCAILRRVLVCVECVLDLRVESLLSEPHLTRVCVCVFVRISPTVPREAGPLYTFFSFFNLRL